MLGTHAHTGALRHLRGRDYRTVLRLDPGILGTRTLRRSPSSKGGTVIMPDCPALADIATSPTLAAEVEVDRIPELLGEIERLRAIFVVATDERRVTMSTK